MTKSNAVKELTQDDPRFLPVKMGLTEQRIAELRKEYDPVNIPPRVVKGDDAYQQVHSKAMSIVKVRTHIEATRKELKADALAWGKKVDGTAKELTAIVEEIEAPWKAAKDAADEAQARAEEEARLAEQARIDGLEVKVMQLKMATEGLLNANSEAIAKRLEKIRAAVITEDEYQEYYDAAVTHHQRAFESLSEALKQREAFEQAQAEQRQAQEELARQQAQMAQQQAELAEQQAIIDKGKRELAEKIEAEEQRKKDAAAQAEAIKRTAEAKDAVPTPTTAPHAVADAVADEVEEQADEMEELAEDIINSAFAAWWNTEGHLMAPHAGESHESFAHRVAEQAWLAAMDD